MRVAGLEILLSMEQIDCLLHLAHVDYPSTLGLYEKRTRPKGANALSPRDAYASALIDDEHGLRSVGARGDDRRGLTQIKIVVGLQDSPFLRVDLHPTYPRERCDLAPCTGRRAERQILDDMTSSGATTSSNSRRRTSR